MYLRKWDKMNRISWMHRVLVSSFRHSCKSALIRLILSAAPLEVANNLSEF